MLSYIISYYMKSLISEQTPTDPMLCQCYVPCDMNLGSRTKRLPRHSLLLPDKSTVADLIQGLGPETLEVVHRIAIRSHELSN